MEFIVRINPSRKLEFIQILEALKSLNVVEHFQHNGENLLSEETEISLYKDRQEEFSTTELVQHYRDLVD